MNEKMRSCYRRWSLLGTMALLLTSIANIASAQDKSGAQFEICGPEVKAEIAKILAEDPAQKDPLSKEAIAFQQAVYEKFSFCAEDIASQPPVLLPKNELCGRTTLVGKLSYESMPCCGYDPQKKMFGCPIRIEQPTGFGPPFSGSREFVLTCVDLGGGLQPVALDTVHLSDAVSGAPRWMFAVLARATERLAGRPLDGKTYRARSILSWNMAPTSCDYKAYWGHALDYQIRLDP